MVKRFIFIALMIFLTAMPLAGACMNVNIYRNSYYPGEAFQAEITGNFTSRISSSNIAFYKDSARIDIPVTISRLGSNKFFVYGEIPANYGNYVFSVKSLCIDKSILVGKTIEKNFNIEKPIYLSYSWLSGEVGQAWPSDSEDNSLALLALSYDYSLSSAGKTALLEKKNTEGECWPWNLPCQVKATSLAAIALRNSESRAWLLNAQNSIEMGTWNLIVEYKGNSECNIKSNSETELFILSGIGNRSISLTLPEDNLIESTLSCDNISIITSAKIVNTYLGAVKEEVMTEQYGKFRASFNNKKCWGKEKNTDCDGESTAYALLALYEFDKTTSADSKAVEWLKIDAETSQNTVEKAIAYLFSNDNDIEKWLLNNQDKNGFFSSKSLALSQTPDMISTAITTFVLSEKGKTDAVTRAKNWMREQHNKNSNFGNLNETAFVLWKIFPSEIEPILSINPAIIRARAGTIFQIQLKNSGMSAINLTASIDGSTKKYSIEKNEAKSAAFTAPEVSAISFKELKIDYYEGSGGDRYYYNIPLMIFPAVIKEQDIEQTVNNTVIGENIIPASLSFTDEEINETLSTNSKKTVELKIKNPSAAALYNISIEYDYALQGLIESINPLTISELNPAEEKTIQIILNTEKAVGGLYSGTITAGANGISASIPFSVNVERTSETAASNQTCSELNGTVCKSDEFCDGNVVTASDGVCCKAECKKAASKTAKKPSTALIVGFVLIGLAIVVIASFFLLRLKPKEESQSAIDKIEKKYAQRY